MLASPEDLEDRLRMTLDLRQAEAVLEGASDEIAGACPGWQLVETTSTVTLIGTGEGSLVLPRPPVTSVDAVTDSDGLPVTGWALRTSIVGKQRVDRLELVSGWVDGADYTVTYTHGFTDQTRPRVLRELCVRLAARMWTNPEQVMQKRRGDYSASFGSSTVESSGLTRWERKMLAGVGLRKTTR
jgi:hypothetical protein